MPVTNVTLEQFGPFDKIELPLCPGVNVLLGANSTGKTFAAKALYAVLRSLSAEDQPAASDQEIVRDKLAAVFRPDEGDIRRLVRRVHGKAIGRIGVEFDGGPEARGSISTASSRPRVRLSTRGLGEAGGGDWSAIESRVPALFLPSREVLSMYEGFVAAYQLRELSFDATYYDTAVALSSSALKGPRPGLLRKVVDRLEHEMGGKIRLEGPRFYLYSDRSGKLEAHLVAEGLRKVASIVHLIANGTLRQGGILIWDEPEANLHPRLADVVVDALGALAEGGVQIVIATHDYLLADAVSRWSEYRDVVDSTAEVRFFQLYRDGEETVQVETADTFVHLERNPLLDAFLTHHDEEQRLAAEDATATRPHRRR